MTRASLGVRSKSTIASSGRLTIGFPRTLKLVFSTTGTPVRRSSSPSRRWKAGFSAAVTLS
jgi:hypothetical protein